jgi:hypothetical protein
MEGRVGHRRSLITDVLAVHVDAVWRVESEHGIVVHTYELDRDAEVYLATGAFDKMIEIDRPWPIRVPISKITPRYRPSA